MRINRQIFYIVVAWCVIVADAACHAQESGTHFSSAQTLRSVVDRARERAGIEQASEGRVYLALRQDGFEIASAWGEAEGDWQKSIASAFDRAVDQLPAVEPFNAVEICLTHTSRTIATNQRREELSNAHRGVRGVEFRFPDQTVHVAPTQMIAANHSFEKAYQHAAKQVGRVGTTLVTTNTPMSVFEVEQFLMRLSDQPRVLPMFRGNTLVVMEDVTQKNVGALGAGLARWLGHHIHDNGRLTYTYLPSEGRESSSANAIRQMHGGGGLARWAQQYPSEGLQRRVHQNLRYNLDNWYRTEDELGFIEVNGKVKLGAIAIAGMCILETQDEQTYRSELMALNRAVNKLWQEDGSFRTFLRPPHRNDNQNFYPGEALLYLAMRYDKKRDPELLARFMQSFSYYAQWHRENRNPAFVPWHTQAYYLMWRNTQDPGLRDFIFEMNDWLLGLQQWNSAAYDDARGRFYDPNRPHLGSPHASSTGVYLEGLIDAYRLAHDVQDTERAEAYRAAIVRGLRSLMQLQFTDEVDAFYISLPEDVRGGIRSRVYDNKIRVDNVSHAIFAVAKIHETFRASDYETPKP